MFMKVLKSYASAELEIKHSRFLGEVFPVISQAEAREVLRSQKEKYADATHVVHAFVVGTAAEILGMSDDGEPPGTAGRPVLDVLKGKNCTNILLTVTRWFGGTLLGTGGLVKAYGDTAKAVLSAARFEPLTAKIQCKVTVPYDVYECIRRFLDKSGATRLEEQFDTAVTVSCFLPASVSGAVRNYITDLTNGTVVPVIRDAGYTAG